MLYFETIGSQVQLRETWQYKGIDVPGAYKVWGNSVQNAHHDGRAVLLYNYYKKTGIYPDVEIPEKDILAIQQGFEYLLMDKHQVLVSERTRFK